MDELTVQELIDYLLQIEDKNTLVVSVDDNGDESHLFIDGTYNNAVHLRQYYED